MPRQRLWWHGRTTYHINRQPLYDLHSGVKKTLVRPEIDRVFQGVGVGQIIVLSSGDFRWPFRITAIRRYQNLEALIAAEDLRSISHGNRFQATDYLATVHEAHLNMPMLAIDLQLISKEAAAWPKTKRG